MTNERTELLEMLGRASRSELEAAYIDAVYAFAQYAEETNEPDINSVMGFATGFLMNAGLP